MVVVAITGRCRSRAGTDTTVYRRHMVTAVTWLRRLDEDALAGRAATRLAITIPLFLLIGALVAGGAGFVSGVFVGLWLFDGYDGILLPYFGAVVGALVGGGLGLRSAVRRKR